MAQTLTPQEAAHLIRPVDSIGFGLGPANPHTFLTALGERDDYEDLLLGGALFLGLFDLLAKPSVRYHSGFFGPAERFYAASGSNIEHVPAGFRQFGPVLERLCPRVMAVQATPPNKDGRVSLSLHFGATLAELHRASVDPDRLLIVETNATLPWTYPLDGYDNTLHVDEIDVIIEGDQSAFELPETPGGDIEEQIAAHALSLIPEDATLQTGIGAIPTLIASRLSEREGGRYGIHSEMLTDGIMRLHKAGKVTNDTKGIFPGVSVTTFALGSRELYDWLDENREVAFAPVDVVNDPSVISHNHNFVSINGAIMVDLYGQIVADSVDGRQISGVGGHEDFVAGAELELEDRSLICLSSVVEVNGVRTSRIVPTLPAGAIVSTPRHHTSIIVTEHGSCDLRGLTVRQRALALAEIAHPEFRSELVQAANSL